MSDETNVYEKNAAVILESGDHEKRPTARPAHSQV
jgi:hypothetical protein